MCRVTGFLMVALIHNNSFSNVSHLFFEQKRRLLEEDNLTVAQGFLGAYPNAFYHFAEANLDNFVSAMETLGSEEDYQNLVLSRYNR